MDGVDMPSRLPDHQGDEAADAARDTSVAGSHGAYHTPSLESLPVEITNSISSYLTTRELGALRLASSMVEQKLRRNFTKVEITNSISSYLTTRELGALRLASSMVEQKLRRNFTKEFFTKKQFMLSEFSLQALIDISRHGLFSSELQHLIIGLDHFNPVNEDMVDPGYKYFLASRAVQADQYWLLQTGRAVAMLAEALRNLPNLQVVDIRDFNSRTRSRDPPLCTWESYGAPSVRRDGRGILLTRSSSRMDSFVDDAFVVVMTALAQAAARPRRLEMLLRDRQWAISERALAIAPCVLPSLVPVLENLLTLHLCPQLYSLARSTTPGSPPPTIYCVNLRKLLGHTKNLKWLRLNFQSDGGNADVFVNWLGLDHASHQAAAAGGSPLPASLSPPPVALPLLERLDLGHTTMSSSALRPVLAKWAPTLKAFSLRYVVLWSVATSGRDHRTGWRELFADLAKDPALNIRHVNIGQLREAEEQAGMQVWRVRKYPVYFAPRSDGSDDDDDESSGDEDSVQDMDLLRDVELHGNSADIFKKLAREVRVNRPKAQHHDDSSDQDDDDD